MTATVTDTSLTVADLKLQAVKDYEDLVWKLAESVPLDDTHACNVVCHAAGKTLDELETDVAAIRRRIDLHPKVCESLTATAERERIVAERKQLEEEFETVRLRHEAQMAEVAGRINACDQRLKATADARQHYRKSAPTWLRERSSKISKRLLDIHRQLGDSPPRKPSDPQDGITLPVQADPEERQRILDSYAKALVRHEENVKRFETRTAQMLEERSSLEQERDALRRAELLLLPTPEDLK